jgi:hypothetical protein
MKQSPGPRRTANLSKSVQQQLNSYALVASSAGVSMLALVASAQAKIVYTPAHTQISHIGIFPYALDLNHDGITDFTFPTSNFFNSGFYESGMAVSPAVRRNRIWGVKYASALKAGIHIGGHGEFIHSSNLSMGWRAGTTHGHRSYRGPWENRGKGVKGRYLGLKFLIKGKFHFGWARINFTDPANVLLTGYAYETIPGKAIIAGATKGPDDSTGEQPDAAVLAAPTPESASLGLLAQGAAGLVAWRRKDTQEEQLSMRERSIL